MGRVSGSTKPPAIPGSKPGAVGASMGASMASSPGATRGRAGTRPAPKILAPVGVSTAVASDVQGLQARPGVQDVQSFIAPADDRLDALDQLVERMAAELVLRHATGRRVLDLGRGAPRVTDCVAPRAASQVVVDAVDLGRSGSVRLPLPDASFDLVYCLRTLPHLGHDAESSEQAATSALSEVARLLGPGGTALVWIDNPLSLWGALHGLRRPARALERGPLVVDSSRGLTRFDTLPRLLRMLPPTLAMTGLHGLRVVTLAPPLLAVPLLGRLLSRAEWWCRDRALVRRLGAHLLVELRRVSRRGPSEIAAGTNGPVSS